MKIIDKRGKLFEKISIVDLVIILFVVLVGLFLFNYFEKGSATVNVDTNKEYVYYTVEVRNVNEAFTEMPQLGDTIYNSSKNFYIGEVTDIVIEPEKKVFDNYEKGTFELGYIEERYRVYLTIKAEASGTEHIKVGAQSIKVGEELPIKGKGYASVTFIVAMEMNEEAN